MPVPWFCNCIHNNRNLSVLLTVSPVKMLTGLTIVSPVNYFSQLSTHPIKSICFDEVSEMNFAAKSGLNTNARTMVFVTAFIITEICQSC